MFAIHTHSSSCSPCYADTFDLPWLDVARIHAHHTTPLVSIAWKNSGEDTCTLHSSPTSKNILCVVCLLIALIPAAHTCDYHQQWAATAC